MTEVFFYHLQRQPLERALPLLLSKCLERGWRVVVQAATDERIAALDDVLWTYRDDSFLPHGTARDGDPTDQPIFLTTGAENPNGAAVRALVEGAHPEAVDGYERVLILFDGADDEALATARAQWKILKEAGHSLAYWQQDDEGRWQKKA
ncbi:DNA polymerase III subunit chi [Agaricicola taiwanensis]|uniref:DNA polymerase III subunit chi n=1 Tax=Agaricicola taiwanensis TaxID=591372 RepID=A0A8J3DWP6_9RHOB|nr:DNA polymerase III subunit chi [Agaricicola taiwanensis]GGE46819.1 DNA polymerase III subunit chi [Agaricicola taiwanensis]